MKLKKLSSNLTLLRKDITRFAPAWLCLSVWLLFAAYGLFQTDPEYRDLYDTLTTPTANLFGLILAMSVFGYLCKPSECGMVHSLPLRRERLFVIHTFSAFLMFLVPMGCYFAATNGMRDMSFGFRLGWAAMEFLYFFGLAVLCMFLTGRKLGAALLYVLLQNLSALAYMVANLLYVPRLPGIYLDNSLAYLSPTSILASTFVDGTDSMEPLLYPITIAVFTVCGLVFLGISLLLYRKRKLERAGDLLAVKWLNPVFAGAAGITSACILSVLNGDISGGVPAWPVLFLGLAIGYLGFYMLSSRSARVFTPKILAGFAALVALVAGSVFVTGLDPFGRVSYTPDPEDVAEARIQEYIYDDSGYRTSDPEAIAELEKLHLDILAQTEAGDYTLSYYNMYGLYDIYISYELKDGTTIHRCYTLSDPDVTQRVEYLLSQPEALLHNYLHVTGVEVYDGGEWTPVMAGRATLMDIVETECEEGKMFTFDYAQESDWRLQIDVRTAEGQESVYIYIPLAAEKTIAWLEEHFGDE